MYTNELDPPQSNDLSRRTFSVHGTRFWRGSGDRFFFTSAATFPFAIGLYFSKTLLPMEWTFTKGKFPFLVVRSDGDATSETILRFILFCTIRFRSTNKTIPIFLPSVYSETIKQYVSEFFVHYIYPSKSCRMFVPWAINALYGKEDVRREEGGDGFKLTVNKSYDVIAWWQNNNVPSLEWRHQLTTSNQRNIKRNIQSIESRRLLPIDLTMQWHVVDVFLDLYFWFLHIWPIIHP